MARPVNSRVIAFIANILFHEVKRSDWRANATVQFFFDCTRAHQSVKKACAKTINQRPENDGRMGRSNSLYALRSHGVATCIGQRP